MFTGVVVGTVTAEDRDEPYTLHTTLKYRIVSQAPSVTPAFSLHGDTGVITVLSPQLDREVIFPDVYLALDSVHKSRFNPWHENQLIKHLCCLFLCLSEFLANLGRESFAVLLFNTEELTMDSYSFSVHESHGCSFLLVKLHVRCCLLLYREDELILLHVISHPPLNRNL